MTRPRLLARRWHAAVAVALVVVASSTPAQRAQADDQAAAIAAARELGRDGVLLADAGKCAEALDKLTRAESLHHAPTILERLGECQVDLGHLVEGTENLQRVVREPLSTNPPPAFVAAVERARKVLALATPKIARLTIQVQAPAGVQVTVRVDGVAVPGALIGFERPTDPGHHTIEVTAPGYEPASRTIDLAPGQTDTAALTLDRQTASAIVAPTATASASAAPPPPPPPVHDAPPPPRPASRLPAYVALGIGGVGLAVGATFGLLAIHGKSQLDGECTDKRCPAGAQADLDGTRRQAAVSSVGFGVGVVGAVVGGLLLLTLPTDTATTSSARLTPVLGLGSIGVRGAF